MKKIILICLLALTACAGDDSREKIKYSDEGDGKPIATLSKRVMLTLAGLSELHEVLNVALNPNDKFTGCATRSADKLEWNCIHNSQRPAGRKGEVKFLKGPDDLEVSTDNVGLAAWVVHGGNTIKGPQDITLKVSHSAFDFTTGYDFQVTKGGGNVSYRIAWQVTGKVTGVAPEFKIDEADILLTISRNLKGRKAVDVQFHITSAETLTLSDCGQVAGKFAFSGKDQEPTAVTSDGRTVHAGKTRGRYAWPTCATNLYGLKIAAPFWTQPEP